MDRETPTAIAPRWHNACGEPIHATRGLRLEGRRKFQPGGSMKIIVGVDDSPHSAAALKWVRETGWPAGSRVILISVPQVMTYALIDPSGASLYEEIHQEQVQS